MIIDWFEQELDKRANSKISRKERLRKEVMAAREMDMLQQQQISDRLQTERSDGNKQEESRVYQLTTP